MTASKAGWETIACPVCDSESFSPLFEKDGEPFVRCEHCGLVMINPRPLFAEIEETYDEAYSHGYIKKADKKARRAARWVNRIKRRHRADGRWLDIGCSAGFILAAAENAGFDAYGVELEAAAVEYGKQSLNLENIVCGQFEAQAYPDNFFDVISLYDVIEHVPDLPSLLSELHRVIKTDGVVEIRTPDVGHWAVPSDLSNWKEVKPSEHLYYFDRDTLTRIFNRHGFRVEEKRFMFKHALDLVFAPKH